MAGANDEMVLGPVAQRLSWSWSSSIPLGDGGLGEGWRRPRMVSDRLGSKLQWSIMRRGANVS